MALTKDAHRILKAHLTKEMSFLDTALDATCGNGYDTAFLCSLGFREVIAFDIQTQAIRATQRRLETAGYENFRIEKKGHEHLNQYFVGNLDCAMFNFGYLPNGDKTISTTATTSVLALSSAIDRLNTNGIISALCYPGHPQGIEETVAIKECLRALPSNYTVREVRSTKATDRTPSLFTVTKTNQ